MNSLTAMPARLAKAADEPSQYAFHGAPTPDNEWMSLRQRVSHGPHLSDGWIAYRRSMNMIPEYCKITSKQDVLAIGVGYRIRSRLRPWTRPRYVFDRAPWPLESWVGADVIAETLCRTVHERRWAALELDSFEGPDADAGLDALGMSTQNRYEFVLDLEPSDDERLAKAKSSHRRKIRRAEKAGVEVRTNKDGDALRGLHALQGYTRQRRASRGDTMTLPRPQQIEEMHKSLVVPGEALVFQGRYQGEVVSSILVGLGGDQAYYLMGGSNEAGLRLDAASLVLWRAMNEARRRGIRWFNLGGVPAEAERDGSPEHGLYRFKDGWGAVRWTCQSGQLRP